MKKNYSAIGESAPTASGCQMIYPRRREEQPLSAHDTDADEELILQIEFSPMWSAMFSECHYTLDSIDPINPVDYATKRLYYQNK